MTYLRCSSFGHGIFSVPRGDLSGISDAGSRVYAVHGFSHFRIFSLRLGKFNIDPRQSTSFIGLPTPANTLFWASLIVGAHDFLVSDSFNALWLLVMVIVMSLLLIAEIPMFSLKFKNLSWEHNKTSYIFLIVSIPLLIFLRTGALRP